MDVVVTSRGGGGPGGGGHENRCYCIDLIVWEFHRQKELLSRSLHGVDLTNQRVIWQCMRNVEEVKKDEWSESPTVVVVAANLWNKNKTS